MGAERQGRSDDDQEDKLKARVRGKMGTNRVNVNLRGCLLMMPFEQCQDY